MKDRENAPQNCATGVQHVFGRILANVQQQVSENIEGLVAEEGFEPPTQGL
jgi:hypothetical protein